MNLKFSYIK